RRDLTSDVAGLADAAHHHPAVAVQNQLDGAHESVVQALHERRDRSGLDLQDVARKAQRRRGVGGRGGSSFGHAKKYSKRRTPVAGEMGRPRRKRAKKKPAGELTPRNWTVKRRA